MKQRCLNPRNASYPDYGGRGIGIYEDWLSFENFFANMLDPPDGLSINRVDNDRGYEPGNCQRATPTEQVANRRRQRRSRRRSGRHLAAIAERQRGTANEDRQR
jgi:hypothetical protein